MERLAFTLFAVFAAVTLCSAQNPNETRVVKDASGRVKYTVQKTGDREIIRTSEVHGARERAAGSDKGFQRTYRRYDTYNERP